MHSDPAAKLQTKYSPIWNMALLTHFLSQRFFDFSQNWKKNFSFWSVCKVPSTWSSWLFQAKIIFRAHTLLSFTVIFKKVCTSKSKMPTQDSSAYMGVQIISYLWRWSSWTANSNKKYMELNGAALNINKPCVTSRKTAFPKDK